MLWAPQTFVHPAPQDTTYQDYSELKKLESRGEKILSRHFVSNWPKDEVIPEPSNALPWIQPQHFIAHLSVTQRSGEYSFLPYFSGHNIEPRAQCGYFNTVGPVFNVQTNSVSCCVQQLSDLLHCQSWSGRQRQKEYRNSYSYINSYSESKYSDYWAISICDITGY